jgi:hypothetical protein
MDQLIFIDIRHACEQGDHLNSYSWRQHDGMSFGKQVLVDGENNVTLTTEFLKNPGGEKGLETRNCSYNFTLNLCDF